jgi:hypothetical protein
LHVDTDVVAAAVVVGCLHWLCAILLHLKVALNARMKPEK